MPFKVLKRINFLSSQQGRKKRQSNPMVYDMILAKEQPAKEIG